MFTNIAKTFTQPVLRRSAMPVANIQVTDSGRSGYAWSNPTCAVEAEAGAVLRGQFAKQHLDAATGGGGVSL